MTTSARVRLSFDADTAKPQVFERNVNLGELRDDGGREFTAQHIFFRIGKGFSNIDYRLALPSIDNFLRPVKQSYHSVDIVFDTFDDRIDAREVWSEIGNTLLRIHDLLPKSRAYHDAEHEHAESQHPEADNLSAYFHLDKMDNFNLAAVLLQKIHDLVARLVFERLGASLLGNLDRNDPDWERFITLFRVREALKGRKANAHVASLSDEEYSKLLSILDDLRKSDDGTKLQRYRNKFVHRIAPSVDRIDLYGYLQDRQKTPITGTEGEVKGWTKGFGGRPTKPEYAFLELYDSAVETLTHYVETLKGLEKIPRFGPEATEGTTSST